MTKTGAKLTVRELVARYGADPFRMSASDLERLAEAIRLLGQPRVFEIAEEQRARCGKTPSWSAAFHQAERVGNRRLAESDSATRA